MRNIDFEKLGAYELISKENIDDLNSVGYLLRQELFSLTTMMTIKCSILASGLRRMTVQA